MSKIDQTGKKILKKQRVNEYRRKTDFIGRIEKKHINALTSGENHITYCFTSIKSDEESDIYEIMEFLENDDKFNFEFKRGKKQTDYTILYIFHKTDRLTMSPEHYFRLRGYLSYYTREFFCSFEGLSFMPLSLAEEEYEPYF